LPLVVAIFVTAQPTFESRHLMAINAWDPPQWT
jgi:hypothetical protein